MAPSLEISIPTTSTDTAGAKPFTLYSISIRQPLRSYVVQKRYSDFAQLHASLISQAGLPPPVPLPKKSWIKSTISSPELTETRRRGLESYLRTVNENSDPRWRQAEAWRQFLNLPTNSLSGEARPGTQSAAGIRHTDLEAAIIEPNVWLDVHRELKAQLGEARQALRRRDAAASAHLQHEAGADVKRFLVRSGTIILALDAGLKSISGHSSGTQPETRPQKLGEGELRRRRDLLSAARKEKDGLERQLNSASTKSSTPVSADSSSSSTPQVSAQRSASPALLGSGRSTNATTSKRVLGAPPKETNQTRELDNAGVLKLQQQIMQEQDEDVTDLTKVVQRLKEMGVQINDELELQNEMLQMLDNDVDRVGNKIDVAKKRVFDDDECLVAIVSGILITLIRTVVSKIPSQTS